MTPVELVSCIQKEVLEANLAIYQRELGAARFPNVQRDSLWPKLAAFSQTLTDDQRQAFIESIRQVMVDTISNMLGILDGSTLLENYRDYFHLKYGGDPHDLNGELQDYFLDSQQTHSA